MKKIIAVAIALIMLVALATNAFAINFNAENHYEAESLMYANQGEVSIIENSSFSGGKAYQLKATNGEDWIFNDYLRVFAPIWQRGWYKISAKVRKGPDCGIVQLWASDTNLRWGEKIDMYSPNEEIVEVTFVKKAMYDLGEERWFEFRIDGKNAASSGYNFVIDTLEINFVEPYEAPGAEFPNYKVSANEAEEDTGYSWNQVAEGGTGRSLYVQFHPTEKNLMFLGTDMGGAYIWDNNNKRWNPITDTFTAKEYKGWSAGIDGLALDPNNPDVLYIACGMYANKGSTYLGHVYKSTDRGKTWDDTGFTGYFGSNGNNRNMLYPIAVDPNNSNVVMCSTLDGKLVRSEDGFKTWTELTVPFGTEINTLNPRGIVFDPTSKTDRGSKKIYLGSTGAGLWVSEDYGNNWSRVSGCPVADDAKIYTMKASNDGSMVVSTGRLYKKDKSGVWTDISPTQVKSYTAAEISISDPDYIITSMHYGPIGSYGEYVYVTTDGGKNWKLLNDTIIRNNVIPRLEYNAFFANVTAISIDPYDRNRVAYAGWSNFGMIEDLFTDSPKVSNYTEGIEHGVIRDLTCSPSGARLFVTSYDYLGGRFTDPTQYMPNMLPPKNSNPSKTAFSEGNPNYVVRLGKSFGSYSTDNGINWKTIESVPVEGVDIISLEISKDPHPETGWPAIYALYGAKEPYVSIDNGKTWTKSNAPATTANSKWSVLNLIAADKTDNNIVYYYSNSDGTVYKSEDYGVTFAPTLTIGGSGEKIATMFGEKDYVFVCTDSKLYYSSTQGELFKQIETDAFDTVTDFSFGKEEKAGDPAVIYVIGYKGDVFGAWRSQDLGKTWKQIYNEATAKNGRVTGGSRVAGDRQEFGIVYIGTSGRGIFYGTEENNNPFIDIRSDEIKVFINNQTVMFDVSPKLINDRTMVPMRKIFEDVGAKVDWDEATQTVTATRIVSDSWEIKTTEVKLTIGQNKIFINGEEKAIDVAPVVIDDRTLVPVRFISEALGGIVEWIDDKQIVKITM